MSFNLFVLFIPDDLPPEQKYADVKVSRHFPAVRRECKEAAAVFFGCFSRNSQMMNDLVRLAGFLNITEDLAHAVVLLLDFA